MEKHWSELSGDEISNLPIHMKLAWLMFWRRFMRLGIVAEGATFHELIDEVAEELKHLMDECRKEGREQAEHG